VSCSSTFADFHATLPGPGPPAVAGPPGRGPGRRPVRGSARRGASPALLRSRVARGRRDTETSLNDVALPCSRRRAARPTCSNATHCPGSLVAMVPVSMSSTDPSGEAREGNSWVAVLCNLGTDTADDLTGCGGSTTRCGAANGSCQPRPGHRHGGQRAVHGRGPDQYGAPASHCRPGPRSTWSSPTPRRRHTALA